MDLDDFFQALREEVVGGNGVLKFRLEFELRHKEIYLIEMTPNTSLPVLTEICWNY